MILDSAKWAEDTFGGCDLGDVRRTIRLITTAGVLASNTTCSLSRAFEGDGAAAEGAHRFMRNEHVDPEAILEGGFLPARQSLRSADTVLALSDTTGMTFWHSVAEELNGINSDGDHQRGWLVQSILAVEAKHGMPLGLLYQRWWQREKVRPGRETRRNRPYEEKESFKWEEAISSVLEAADVQTRNVIWVSDRESDIYELLSFFEERKQRFIVRSSVNRKTEAGLLWDELNKLPCIATRSIELEQKSGRPARTATTHVRYGRVVIREPHGGKLKLSLNAISVREDNPPKGREPLNWILLTNEPLTDPADAIQLIEYYERRWQIEDFHKAWKSGCKAEERRQQEAENLQRLLVILTFLAVRLLQLRYMAEKAPETSCEAYFTTEQWRTLHRVLHRRRPQPLPDQAPTILWAFQALGKLGGWLNTKRNNRVGWDALAAGMVKLDLVLEYEASKM